MMMLKRNTYWITLLAVLNSAYLASTADPSMFYFGNLFLHLFLGVASIALWVMLATKMWRDAELSKLFTVVTLILMLIATETGLHLLFVGNLKAQSAILTAHIISSAGVMIFVFIWLWIKIKSEKLKLGLLASFIIIGLIAPFIADAAYQEKYTIKNEGLPPMTMAGEVQGGANGPFFPSANKTSTGGLIPAKFFLDSETCGTENCHPDLVSQWKSSAHHFSSLNNQWYRKSIEYMQDVNGAESVQWCAGCHDPAILLTGNMMKPISENVGTPEAEAGLGCMSCHNVVDIDNTMGNGGFLLEYPELHDLATSDNPLVKKLHDFIMHVDPEPHRRSFMKPFHVEQTSEFCSSCHKVHLDSPVNNFKWMRGFNEYDNWQASGVSHNGARSFYAPAEPKDCSSCHMPLTNSEDAANIDGFVHNHRFAAANTALPTANKDTLQLEAVTDFLTNNKVAVDIFAVSEPESLTKIVADRQAGNPNLNMMSSFAIGQEQAMQEGAGGLTESATAVLAPLSNGETVLKPGSSVRLDVVTKTLGLGHFFPGGTIDAQEAWLELKAVDDAGNILLWSGWVENNDSAYVDPAAHYFRNRVVDEHSNLINKRNAFHMRAVVYVNLIPPGAADVAHYRLNIPEDVVGNVQVTARLRYRKFDWWHTQFSFAGEFGEGEVSTSFDDRPVTFTKDLSDVSAVDKEIPILPIVTMATDSMTLNVAGEVVMPAFESNDQLRRRWNDYGIGLLREGDLKSAVQAFKKVTEIDPTYADGWVNAARAFIQEGSLENALEMLEEAEKAQPGFHKTAYFRGLYYKALGEYDQALIDLMRVARDYPNDRVVQNQIGRVHYLNADYQSAITAFLQVLTVDKEDLMAHYNLMLCYRGLGEIEQSEIHQTLYERFKADESAASIALKYRQTHPEDNNEAQAIHEHGNSWE